MVTEADYLDLTKRITSLDRRRAVLESQEQDRKRLRDELLEKLKDAGLNLEDIPGEIQRLEKLVDNDFKAHQVNVDEFEKKLQELEAGPSTEVVKPTPPVVDIRPNADPLSEAVEFE